MADDKDQSLEEINKQRIALGLKPLTDDKPPENDPEKQAEENYKKRRQQEAKERESKEIADRIAKNRNKLELNRKLVGATLGDEDAVVDDTVKWIKRSKKKAKELAAKRQAELESRDNMYTENYTEKDLENVQVRHNIDDFEEGTSTILTLADKRVLEDGEDELQNVEMAERAKDRERNELKTKRRDYTGYDDDEFVEGNEGIKKSVLAKYDEDISGPQQSSGFRLGAGIPSSSTQRRARDRTEEVIAPTVNKTLLSIDYAKNQEIMDYLQEGDVGFKKPKAKKKKSSRRVPIDSELAALDGEAPVEASSDVKMEVDTAQVVQRDLDANFIDDDDLQASLARSRRQKVKKAKFTPEDIAQQIAEQATQGGPLDDTDTGMETAPTGDEASAGLMFDETSEFVRAISYTPVVKPERHEPLIVRIKTERPLSPPRDVKMAGDEALTELEAREEGEADDSDEDMEDDAAVMSALEQAISAAELEQKGQQVEVADDGIGSGANETFAGGMAGTLSILRKQGIMQSSTHDAQDRESTQKAHDQWLAQHRQRLTQHERERMKSRTSGKDQATREYENRLREQENARMEEYEFKNYKPDVDIKYFDEYGRQMTPKEAWKALSHRFHGKGSGRAKTEKRLKKIAEEKKREAMLSGDTPTSMNEAFQHRQQKAGQAHMVLSVGNRGAVPQLEEFLDNAALSKAAKEDKGKGKKRGAAGNAPVQVVDITGFTNAHALMPVGASAEHSPGPAPSSTPNGPAPPSMMKPSFSRVVGEATLPTAGATPMNGDRNKVAFGFGNKRKAQDDGSSTPPIKKR